MMLMMIAEAVATAIQTQSDKAAANDSVDQEFQDYIASLVLDKAASMKKKVTIASTSAQASSTSAGPAPSCDTELYSWLPKEVTVSGKTSGGEQSVRAGFKHITATKHSHLCIDCCQHVQ